MDDQRGLTLRRPAGEEGANLGRIVRGTAVFEGAGFLGRELLAGGIEYDEHRKTFFKWIAVAEIEVGVALGAVAPVGIDADEDVIFF